MQEDPQMNLLLQQSLDYQIHCKESEYHLDRNMVMTVEEESQLEVFEEFYDLSWEILGKSCKEDNWLVLDKIYDMVIWFRGQGEVRS